MKSYSVPQSETDRNLKESDRDLFGKSFLKASAERKRGRDYYELKNELERSLHKNMEEMEDRRRFKWCSLVLVYHPAIILAQIFSQKRQITSFMLGIVFLGFYLVAEMLFRKQKSKISKISLEAIRAISSVFLIYDAFSLMQALMEEQPQKTTFFEYQVIFHAYATLVFASSNGWMLQDKMIILKFCGLEAIQIIFFAIGVRFKYKQILEDSNVNAVLDVLVFVQFTIANYLIAEKMRDNLKYLRHFSFQSDLHQLKVKKLELFLANLDNQKIILVQSDSTEDAALSKNTFFLIYYQINVFLRINITKFIGHCYKEKLKNELFEKSPALKEKLVDMETQFEEIKYYQVDEKGKKLEDVLFSKSMGDEWNQPNIYWFQIRKEYQESLETKFIGFLDWRVNRQETGEDELDSSRLYYAIQIIENQGLIRKINDKQDCLSSFIKIVKEQVSKNSYHYNVADLNKVVDLCDDICQIISKEIDLYLLLTYPKDHALKKTTFKATVAAGSSPDYSTSQVQNNMSLFFKLFQQMVQPMHNPKLEFSELPLSNFKFAKEGYLSVIHLIINALMNFLKSADSFKISFAQKNTFHIRIRRLDESRAFNSFEDSFENIINKAHKLTPVQFEYHKEISAGTIIYSFDLSESQQQQQSKQLAGGQGSIVQDPSSLFNNPNNYESFHNIQLGKINNIPQNERTYQTFGSSFRPEKEDKKHDKFFRQTAKELTFNLQNNNNEYTFDLR